MTVSRQLPPYEMFAAMRPRLLNRPADTGAVTMLGQAVSDVLDERGPESELLQIVADLESARSDAANATINERWELPLTGMLGLLRQNLHNRTVRAAAVNPSSSTLRDKVLAAIDAGVDTPTLIGEHVQSPTTVVSRVLRQLTDEGRVERAEQSEDKRRRHYRLVDAPNQVAAAEEGVPSPPIRGLHDPATLIQFAELQTQSNARNAAALLPDLIAAGSNVRLDAALRVAALSAAGVIMRSTDTGAAKEDAVDLAETTDLIAKDSDDELVEARGAYELARAGLFAFPDQPENYLPDLQRAEELAALETSTAAKIRLGWCAYTRCLIERITDPFSAREHAERAVDHFRGANFSYGEAAALTLLVRVSSGTGSLEDAGQLAFKALSISNSHGYLRVMAESSYWAGQLLAETEPAHAARLLINAAEQFEAVGSPSWQERAERELSRLTASTFSPLLPSGTWMSGEFPAQQETEGYF